MMLTNPKYLPSTVEEVQGQVVLLVRAQDRIKMLYKLIKCTIQSDEIEDRITPDELAGLLYVVSNLFIELEVLTSELSARIDFLALSEAEREKLIKSYLPKMA